jgi:phosphate uptake regulator
MNIINNYKHICNNTEIVQHINIECNNCINNINKNCTCSTKIVKKILCSHCENIRNQIKQLEIEIDEILYNLSYDIKNYENCENMINRLSEISIILRFFHRILLEKM